MTLDERIDIGRRLRAVGVKPARGMVILTDEFDAGQPWQGDAVILDDGPDPECADRYSTGPLLGSAEWVPDVGEPATIGCLLALVREAWGPRMGVVWDATGCTVYAHYTEARGRTRSFSGPTEAEALVAALEAAS